MSRITDRYIILYHFMSFFVLFCFTSVLILFFLHFVQFCSLFSASVLLLLYFMLLWIPCLMIQRTAPRERTRGDSKQMGRCFLFCISSASVPLPFCFCSVAVLFHAVVVAAPDDPEGKDLRRFHRTVTTG